MPEHRRPHLSYNRIVELIERGRSVLDLGCGDGELLLRLTREKEARGRGVDIEESMVMQCIAKGLSVFQGNLDEGLKDLGSAVYDYVVLNQTLQVTRRPTLVVSEMLRVGRKAIVAFPNFGNWRLIGQLLFRGRMPVTADLPYQWYDTPNIHLCTRGDFVDYCARNGIRILKEIRIGGGSGILSRAAVSLMPNLFATEVMFVLKGKRGAE